MDNILSRLFYANVIGNVAKMVVFKFKVGFIPFFQAYYPCFHFEQSTKFLYYFNINKLFEYTNWLFLPM